MTEAKPNRRQFTTAAAGACSAVACGGLSSCASSGGAPPPPAGPVDVGAPADFPKDRVYDRWAKSHGFFVVRYAGRLYAVSAVCTHRRCTLDGEGNRMVCPCHGSEFTKAGLPEGGPAKEPLGRFGMMVTADGRLIVDTARRFDGA